MNTYVSFLNRFKWALLVCITVLMVVLTINNFKLTFDGSYRIWFGENSTILKKYDRFCATFGNDDTILVVFSDKDGIMTPKALQSIDKISKTFEKMDNVRKVSSLLNYQYIHVSPEDEDDIIVENFIEDPKNIGLDELSIKKKIALNDSMIRDYIISKDAKTTMIAIQLASFTENRKSIHDTLVLNIKKVLKDEKKITGYDYKISGAPVTDFALANIADHDAIFHIPISFLIIVIVLYLFFKTILGVIIPIVTVIFASIMTLSFYYFMGLELNNFSINIPIFITAIGIADAVHFYTSWVNQRYTGQTNIQAVAAALRKNFVPMSLTTMTTAVGFGSLSNSAIVPMSTLGYTIALGSIAALILTLSLLPVILLCIKEDYMPAQIRSIRCLVQEFNYPAFVIRHDHKIVFISLLVAIGIGWGVVYTKYDSNSIKYFNKSTDVSKAAYYTMDNITGPSTYEVVIDSHVPDGIKDPIFLKKVALFDEEIKSKFPEIRYSSSLLDVIKKFQDILVPSHLPEETIGKTQNINAQYLLLYSLSLPQGMEINDKMDLGQQKLRMTIQSDIVNSSKSLEIMQWTEEWWEEHALSAEIQGQVSMFAHMQEMVADTLLNSLTQTFMIIAILMFLVIRNVRLLVIFLIPNLLPLIISIGFLGWMGISINVGIAMASVVVLGLAVDDTIYFFNKYKEAKKYRLNMTQTFYYILEHSGSAMVFTTVILSAAFSIFLVSDFVPNIHFAFMTISTMVLALFADLLLAPALLSILEKTFPEDKGN